jgi:hypothetical protein
MWGFYPICISSFGSGRFLIFFGICCLFHPKFTLHNTLINIALNDVMILMKVPFNVLEKETETTPSNLRWMINLTKPFSRVEWLDYS